MVDRIHELQKNAPFKRGIVREVDGKTGKARVEFKDEDGVVSFWLNVNQTAAASNKSYWMPDINSQVNCLVDWLGEDGSVLGSFYSKADPPPTEDPDIQTQKYESGLEIQVNKKTGDVKIIGAKSISLESTSGVSIIAAGAVAIESDELTHNGKNVGHNHKHGGVVIGGDITDEPI